MKASSLNLLLVALLLSTFGIGCGSGGDSSSTSSRSIVTPLPTIDPSSSPAATVSPTPGAPNPNAFNEIIYTNGAASLQMKLGNNKDTECTTGTTILWTVVGDSNKLQIANPTTCQPTITFSPSFDSINISVQAVAYLSTGNYTYTAVLQAIDPAKCTAAGGAGVVGNLCAFSVCSTSDECQAKATGADRFISSMNGTTADPAVGKANADGLCIVQNANYSKAADFQTAVIHPSCGYYFGLSNYDSKAQKFSGHGQYPLCGKDITVISQVRCGKASL